MAKRIKRVGIFGGSFDPPHIGHLIIAEMARRSADLDVVYFVPAYRPPHKQGSHPSTARERYAMARLAVRGNRHLRVSDAELRRGGISYTVDTVKTFRRKFPSAELFLIIGGDSLSQFSSWKFPEQILAETSLIVYRRPRTRTLRSFPTTAIVSYVDGPRMDISSTEIRDRIRLHKSIRYLVRDNVLEFIESKKLYAERKR
jgi:nicotinate-nucleotide adenylyltransferase